MRTLPLALAAMFLLQACKPGPSGAATSSSASGDRRGGTMVLSSWGGPKTFNPIVENESSSSDFTSLLHGYLTESDPVTGLPRPQLAESWTIDSTGKVYTFRLREGLRFNDGTPLRASDVVFTWTRLAFDTAVECAMRDILRVDGKLPVVEALDEHTVRFTLPTVFAPFLSSAGGLPILSEKHLAGKTGKGFNSVYGVDTPPDSLIGAGPFRLALYQAGSRGVFVPNRFWYKKDSAGNQLPYLDTVIRMVVQDQKAEVLKFKAGELDVLGVTPQDFPVIKPLEAEGKFTIYKLGPSLSSVYLCFNQNPAKSPKGAALVDPVHLAWFRDPYFRKAVDFAIDREAIRNIVWNGLGRDANGPTSPSNGYWWNALLPACGKNLDSAKASLEAGGYQKGPDGKLRDRSGHPVKFTLVTNAENQMRIDMAGLARKDLEALGMEVVFTQEEFNNLVKRLDATFDWEVVMMGLTGGGDPHNGANVWLSSGRTHMWYPKQKSPATPWEKQLDSLVSAGVQIPDTAVRKVVYDRIQEIVHRERPYVYLGHPESMVAVRNKFGNIKPTVLGGALHNIDEIYLLPVGGTAP